jgi:hypothetical protein
MYHPLTKQAKNFRAENLQPSEKTGVILRAPDAENLVKTLRLSWNVETLFRVGIISDLDFSRSARSPHFIRRNQDQKRRIHGTAARPGSRGVTTAASQRIKGRPATQALVCRSPDAAVRDRHIGPAAWSRTGGKAEIS